MTAARPGPCRPYVVGEHARAIRNRVLLAAAVALAAALVLPPLLTAAARALAPTASGVVDLLDTAGFAVVYLVALWLVVGPGRLSAIEILVWGSRSAAAGYAAVTGIRDPTDAAAAAAWLRANPPAPNEAPEARYWRAHAHLVAGDLAGARSVLATLRDVAEYGYAVASLEAQLALAEGTEPHLDDVAARAETWNDPLGHAVAMANLGALRAQRAFVCGEDDVAAVLTVRSGVDGRPARFFLIRAWLPIIGITMAAWLIARLVGTA
jgi:hypothetical protein